MADRGHIDKILTETIDGSLADFADELGPQLRGPLRTAATFVAAYVSTAELTPKRPLDAIALAARTTGTDFAGLVLVILSELSDQLPDDQQSECDAAIKLGVQASILFNVGDDETDLDITQAMLGCYAAMLDPEMRG